MVLRHLHAWMVGALLMTVSPALAQYRLELGDTIEISVAGIPELRQRSTVDLDGSIAVPLAGTLQAQGRTVSDVRQAIQKQLRVYRQRTQDGKETILAINADEISVSVAEYRPVFVSGNVAHPGQQPFRPGMTVRQAVAVAGGVGIVDRLGDLVLQVVDLQSERGSVMAEYAREAARVWRLRAELGETVPAEPPEFGNLALPQAFKSELLDLETKQKASREADLQKDRDSLQRSIELADHRMSLLTEQQQKEEEGNRADTADLERVTALFERGATPVTRVTDARRLLLISSTRLLQTSSQLAQLEREREDLARRRNKVDDQHRIEVLRDLQDANLRLVTLGQKLSGISEKLALAGSTRAQLAAGRPSSVSINVLRSNHSGAGRTPATEDTVLGPGDLVEIAVHPDGATDVAGP